MITACSGIGDLRALRVSRSIKALHPAQIPKSCRVGYSDPDIRKATILHIGLWGSLKAIEFHVGLMFHKSDEIGDKTLERESHISHWPIRLLYTAVVLNEPQKRRATAT